MSFWHCCSIIIVILVHLADSYYINCPMCASCDSLIRFEFDSNRVQTNEGFRRGMPCDFSMEMMDLTFCGVGEKDSFQSTSLVSVSMNQSHPYTSACRACHMNHPSHIHCSSKNITRSVAMTTNDLVLCLGTAVINFCSLCYSLYGVKSQISKTEFWIAVVAGLAGTGITIGKLFPLTYSCCQSRKCDHVVQLNVLAIIGFIPECLLCFMQYILKEEVLYSKRPEIGSENTCCSLCNPVKSCYVAILDKWKKVSSAVVPFKLVVANILSLIWSIESLVDALNTLDPNSAALVTVGFGIGLDIVALISVGVYGGSLQYKQAQREVSNTLCAKKPV